MNRKTKIVAEEIGVALPEELGNTLASATKIEYVFLSTDANKPGWFFDEAHAKKNFASFEKIRNPNFNTEKE